MKNFENAAQVYSEGIALKYQEQIISKEQLQLYAKKDYLAGCLYGFGSGIEQPSKATELPDKPNFWNEIAKMQKDCGTYREHYSKDEQSAMYNMADVQKSKTVDVLKALVLIKDIEENFNH